jgi:hypothetical protein
MFTFRWYIFNARTLDRMGKGLRNGARDALLSNATTPENKAKVYRFHRSLDTLGAVLSPVNTLAYLHFYPAQYLILFFFSFCA